ncbi:MAG: hypothetical protein E6Q62_10780 [Nitrosomonas sp.]|nr:MAG: hypothetical protein E6Q62_10780 [Nitrosomonas sp.]
MKRHVINLSSLDGKNGFRLDGTLAYDSSGSMVSDAGDVNGDGFDDLLIFAPGATYPGITYVVFGKSSGFSAASDLTGIDGSNGFRLIKMEPSRFLFSSASSAGDVNGDGFDDVIIGAGGADPNDVYNAGSSYIVFGKSSRFGATLDVSSLNGCNGFRLDGVAINDFSGSSVSTAGDVNGDGFDDVIVSTYYTDLNGAYSGSSYVIFGKASGFDAALKLSNLNGNNGFRIDGLAAYDFLGRSISSAGDINGDGFDDLIIAADGADPNGNKWAGSSYVIFGKAAGFGAALDLSRIDGKNGFRLDGEAYDFSSDPVSNAGDVNGDGFDDLIIAARGVDPHGKKWAGSSYVVFGKAFGFDATLKLSMLNGSNGFRLDGGVAYDLSGFSVSDAGDVNGDGFDDLLIGSPNASPHGRYSGSSYVVYGKASGFGATLNLSTLNSNSGFRIDGAVSRDFAGESVSSAGDVNGDGFADFLIGADGADPNGIEMAGSSYVLFGGDFTYSVTRLGTSNADHLVGTKMADRFVAGIGNDKMLGRGGADVFHGGAGNDTLSVSDHRFRLVDGGSGTDTLKFSGNHLNLNLKHFHNRINSIEAIDMAGHGHNTLTLNVLDVLNLSDSGNTLKVTGNTGDRVAGLKHGWEDAGIHGNFHTYTNDAAVLLVGVNVTTDFPIA